MMLLVLVLLSLQVNANSVSEFQFDVVPASVVAFLGERVEYHCVAPCAGIFWLINGTVAVADRNLEVATWTRPRSDGAPGEESTLWITASVYTNNSAIKCCVEDRSIAFETHSSPAYLIVQGLLSPPANIQVELQREGQFVFVIISWDQPFTLNITNRDNTIRYQVFVYLSGNSSLVYNTSTTDFTYNHSANALSDCSNNSLPTVQVSAINQVGSSSESDPVNLHHALCITSLIQSTSTVAGHSSGSLNSNLRIAAMHTSTLKFAPKPTVIQPALTPHNINTETQNLMIVIIATVAALFLIMLGVIIVIICSISMKKRFTNNEMNTFYIPNSISLELNINNAYDLSSDQKPDHHELSAKDTHYSEVEQPEALYAEIPV